MMKTKIELYFMSLGLLFGLLLIKAIKIPICFDDDAKFVGYCNLIKMNIPTLVCFFFLLLSISVLSVSYIVWKESFSKGVEKICRILKRRGLTSIIKNICELYRTYIII